MAINLNSWVMGVRQTLCERSEWATEKPENGSGRKFKILWIWESGRENLGYVITVLQIVGALKAKIEINHCSLKILSKIFLYSLAQIRSRYKIVRALALENCPNSSN